MQKYILLAFVLIPALILGSYRTSYSQEPLTDVKVNNADSPVALTQSDTLTISLAVDSGGKTDDADWWFAADTPAGVFFLAPKGWTPEILPAYQGPLFNLPLSSLPGIPLSGLPNGPYTFCAGVDTVMDGNITWDKLSFDCATIYLGADRELKITAKVLGTNEELQCPPVCIEIENPEDKAVPVYFNVWSSATGFIQIETGKSAKVSADAVIRAPDGKSYGEQMATMEEDTYLKFHSWENGKTDNPRIAVFSGQSKEITAFYTVWEPDYITTTAEAAGCNWTGPVCGPNWVEVKSNPYYQKITGPVVAAHTAGEDYPGSHNTQDYNFFVLLSGEDIYNILSHNTDGQYGKRPDQIEVEWETGSYPRWAWPSSEAINIDEQEVPKTDDCDLAVVIGKHIFDCGHQEDEIVEGAWTEMHPPVGVAVMRGTRQGKLFLREDIEKYFPEMNERAKGIEGVQVDVWFNGDGGGAVEHVKCGPLLGCFSQTGCVFTPAFDIRGIYEFDVPLPPPPSTYPESQYRIKILRLLQGQPQPVVSQVSTPAGQKLHVKIDLSNYTDTWLTCGQQNKLYGEELTNCKGDAYGFTVIAGWEIFEYPPDLRRIRLIVNDVKIYDDYEGEDGDGEFKIWLDVGPSTILAGDPLETTSSSGSVALHEIDSGLNDAPGDGETYPMIKDGSYLTYLFNIRENDTESNKLRIYTHGYEDDTIWDDGLNSLLRVFYPGYTVWEPDNGYPAWATGSYGEETNFGTERANVSQPIPYDDHVWGDCGSVPCWGYSLGYTLEELLLP